MYFVGYRTGKYLIFKFLIINFIIIIIIIIITFAMLPLHDFYHNIYALHHGLFHRLFLIS